MALPDSDQPIRDCKIRVVGVGGCGCAAAGGLMREDLPNVALAAVDADWTCVRAADVHRRIELRGVPIRGLGSGGWSEWARQTAEFCADALLDALRGSDMVLVVAGLGGGTGTGAAPVVARLASETGALTIGVATLPLDLESHHRKRLAAEGLPELLAAADAVIVVPCEALLALTGQTITVTAFFEKMNQVLRDGICSIIAAVREPDRPAIRFDGVGVDFRQGRSHETRFDPLINLLQKRLLD